LKEEERLDLLKRRRREVEFGKDFERRKGTWCYKKKEVKREKSKKSGYTFQEALTCTREEKISDKTFGVDFKVTQLNSCFFFNHITNFTSYCWMSRYKLSSFVMILHYHLLLLLT
jgi:hypothetical protein